MLIIIIRDVDYYSLMLIIITKYCSYYSASIAVAYLFTIIIIIIS